MTHKIEEIDGCTRKIVYDFEASLLNDEVSKTLKRKRGEVTIKGFRKGMAPLSVVEKIYGGQVQNEALQHFISREFGNTIRDEDFRLAGDPSFSNVSYDPEKGISFEALIEIFPAFELPDMGSLSFKKESVEVTEKDIEETKARFLESQGQLEEVKEARELKTGDTAVFHFEGEKEDGERPDNMKGQDFSLEIGSGRFIPGFEEGMIGLKKGEKKSIELTFPAEYHEPSLQNAKVTFHVELLEIKEKKIPELSDEVVKKAGYETVEDFQTKIKADLESSRKNEAMRKLNDEITKKLVESVSFDIPKALVFKQKEFLKDDLRQNLKRQGMDDSGVQEYFTKWDNDFNEKAEFQVRSGLILNKLSEEHGVEATDEDLNKKIEEVAQNTGLGAEEVKKFYLRSSDMKANLMYGIREEKTFAKIHELVSIEE